MDILVVVLQKQYRLKRLQQCFKISLINPRNGFYSSIKRLDILADNPHIQFQTRQESTDMNYDRLTKLLMSPSVLRATDDFLTRYYNWIGTHEEISKRLNARQFLSLFMILGCNETVLGLTTEQLKKMHGYERDVYDIAGNLRRLLMGLFTNDTTPENFRKFAKAMNIYSNAFEVFMNLDKLKQIDALSREWYEMEKTMENMTMDDETQTIITTIRQSQGQLIGVIHRIIPRLSIDELLHDLRTYKVFADKLEHNMKKAYWDILMMELVDKKYDMLQRILEEIQHILFELRPSLRDTLHEYFDVSFIVQLISAGTFSFIDFERYGEFLVLQIKELQAPIRTENTMRRWNEIRGTTFQNLISATIVLLKFIMNELLDINQDIINMKILASMGIAL